MKSEHRSATVDEAACQPVVPEYEELTPCLKEVTKIWEQMINTPNRSVTKFDTDVFTSAVQQGWFLISQRAVNYPPQPFYSPFSGTTRVRTSGLHVTMEE